MEFEDILAEASALLTDTREDTYGNFWNNHRRIGVIWAELLELDEDIPPHLVALMMSIVKISRAVNDSKHADNYVDAVAYIGKAGAIATGSE
jgi:hypothetical protein